MRVEYKINADAIYESGNESRDAFMQFLAYHSILGSSWDHVLAGIRGFDHGKWGLCEKGSGKLWLYWAQMNHKTASQRDASFAPTNGPLLIQDADNRLALLKGRRAELQQEMDTVRGALDRIDMSLAAIDEQIREYDTTETRG